MRVVVSSIVDTITGEEVQDPLSVRPKELGPFAKYVGHVHLQHVKQSYPLRVYTVGI
jgi:hypothetical protein